MQLEQLSDKRVRSLFLILFLFVIMCWKFVAWVLTHRILTCSIKDNIWHLPVHLLEHFSNGNYIASLFRTLRKNRGSSHWLSFKWQHYLMPWAFQMSRKSSTPLVPFTIRWDLNGNVMNRIGEFNKRRG